MTRDRARDRDQLRFIEQRRLRLLEAGVVAAREDDDRRFPIYYKSDQIVAAASDADSVEDDLRRLVGTIRGRRRLRDDDVDAPVVIEYSAGDPIEIIDRVNRGRAGRGAGAAGIAPLHVLSPCPPTKIGPGGDPWPAVPAERGSSGPTVPAAAPRVGVVDTGLWQPPAETLHVADTGSVDDVDPVDLRPQASEIDYPGAGHGGFVAGVVTHTAAGVEVISRRGYERVGSTTRCARHPHRGERRRHRGRGRRRRGHDRQPLTGYLRRR